MFVRCHFYFRDVFCTEQEVVRSVNGMVQTTVSVARALAPAASTSLFAYSQQTNWLGGDAVYLILMSLFDS